LLFSRGIRRVDSPPFAAPLRECILFVGPLSQMLRCGPPGLGHGEKGAAGRCGNYELRAFQKKTQTTSQRDMGLAKKRCTERPKDAQ